jgi:hypothetical protein
VTLRLDTVNGIVPVEDEFDDQGTSPIGVPAHLDEETLAFVARIQKEANRRVRDAQLQAQRAAADASHETAERIAADFDAIQAGIPGRGLLMAPGAAAARVRSLAWAGARAS